MSACTIGLPAPVQQTPMPGSTSSSDGSSSSGGGDIRSAPTTSHGGTGDALIGSGGGRNDPSGRCGRSVCVRARTALWSTATPSPSSPETYSSDCDLVAAAPLEARQSAEAYAHWLGVLG